MIRVTLLLGTIGFAWFTSAIPEVAFPINSQVPPLAQVAQPFNFQFPANTFTSSDSSRLDYVLQGAPAWLLLDSTSRTFTGTPSDNDVGNVDFQLVASDDNGRVSMPVTLVVANTPVPRLAANITDVLASAGPLSDIQSLALYPKATFSVTFPQDTFTGLPNLQYTATSEDRSPLPSWIRFNPTTMALSGITPPPVPNPQVVSIRLIASDIAGFEGQSLVFNLMISDHEFVFSSVVQQVAGSAGQFVNVTTELLLDKQPATPNIIASVQADDSAWLQFDGESMSLSGQVPPDYEPQDIKVVASDIYNDNAYTYLRIGPELQQPISPATSSTSAAARSVAGTQSTQASAPSESGESSDPSTSQAAGRSRQKNLIVLAIVLPIVVAVIALFLGILCIRRRRRRRNTRNYVEHSAVGPNVQKHKNKDHRLSMAIATTSPMGSPEQRHWDSQEHLSSFVGLGLRMPQSGARQSTIDPHPLRSHAVPPLPPKRSSKRLSSKNSLRPSKRESSTQIPSSRHRRAPWSPMVHGARDGGLENIAKCAHCGSDNLQCRDCNETHIISALEQVKARRRSQLAATHQPSVRRVVDDSSNYGSSAEIDREKERQEAEEYIKQPLEKKFENFRKQRRDSRKTGGRFSNSGSGSSAAGVRRWHSGGSVRGPHSRSAMRSFSETSMPIPEESPGTEIRHVPGDSQGSESSWCTYSVGQSHNELGLDRSEFRRNPPEPSEQSAERGDHEYGQMVSGIKLVGGRDNEADEDEEAQAGAMEPCPSSDSGRVFI